MRFCDDCNNFPEPDSFLWSCRKFGKEVCKAGLPMLFKLPESQVCQEWGFYHKDCEHFKEKESM